MVLSIVNLQEAYAKALLVDRDALRAAQEAGDVLGGHEVLLDAYRSDVREVCARARAALGAEEDPIARAPRVVATQSANGRGALMSTVTPLIDRVEDLWPDDSAARRGARPARAGLAPAGRRTARCRTSAAATRRPRARAHDHTGREIAGHVGQGLGLRPRDDGAGALHRAQARRGAAADRARRDERRGHGRLPVALPARSRGAALLDRDAAARVRPGAARPPHAPRRHQRARRQRRRRAARARSASATPPRGSPTSGPASRCRSRSARRRAPTRT